MIIYLFNMCLDGAHTGASKQEEENKTVNLRVRKENVSDCNSTAEHLQNYGSGFHSALQVNGSNTGARINVGAERLCRTSDMFDLYVIM